MLHRSVLFLFALNILHFGFELRIDQMDFCCSNTCCCSSCITEQCQLPDQPGKQCRCYNTTNTMCSRFRNFAYKPEVIEFPQFVPAQPGMALVVPISTITDVAIDPLCCMLGNCPVWIKCKNPQNVKKDQSAEQPTPMPLFIAACTLLALIAVTMIGLCIAAGLYISNSQKRRDRNVYDGNERN